MVSHRSCGAQLAEEESIIGDGEREAAWSKDDRRVEASLDQYFSGGSAPVRASFVASVLCTSCAQLFCTRYRRIPFVPRPHQRDNTVSAAPWASRRRGRKGAATNSIFFIFILFLFQFRFT